jgi:FkbM family methyltransferase
MNMPNLTLDQYEQLQPNMEYTLDNGNVRDTNTPKITFLTPNRHCAWRVSSLDTKEPDTIAWIKQMGEGDVLWDVGANMGQYGLLAAKKGAAVHAFEPESQNFALLCRNIGINKLGDFITAWPLALSDTSGFDFFWSQGLQAGGSCNSYGTPLNFHLQPKVYAVRQGAAAITGNEFCNKFGQPTHIKIDVDGLEHKVLAGMGGVLPDVRSVLIELNTALPEHLAIYELMADMGLHPDAETADIARRTEGPFAGIGNVIFYRNKADFLSAK